MTHMPARGWRERWQAWRDRRLADPAFQQRAATFFLTRPIARRRAARVFDLVAGFVYSQVLRACVELELFDILAAGPLTLEAAAARLHLPVDAAERLLSAAIALRLVEHRRGGRYGLGALGAPLVGNAGVAAMVRHHALLYADLADPVPLLRGATTQTRLAGYWPYAAGAEPKAAGAADVAAYSQLMSVSQPLVAGAILGAVDLARHRTLLDVGGGEGEFLVAAAARAPRLRLVLFDLPAVVARGRARLDHAGLADRADVVGGDFHRDPLPHGADAISFVRVLHDHDEESVRRLLRAAFEALLPGGTVIVAEPMAETPGAEAMGDAYFGFYLLAMGRGRPRSAERLTRLLRESGFAGIALRPTGQPLQARVVTGSKPLGKP